MYILQWIGDNKDILIVLTSLVAIVFTLISVQNQIRHNKNSVLPLCEINALDYLNDIGVHIYNNGLGPMIIEKLRCYNSTEEKAILLELMPDIEQAYITYQHNIDGRSVQPGGKLRLLELCPADDNIRKLVRKTLSEITIKVDYKDVYGTKFNKTRRLSDVFSYFNTEYNSD